MPSLTATAPTSSASQEQGEAVATRYRAVSFADGETGALDIRLAARRVLSLPSQLGCPVGCTFCNSKEVPLRRNLRTEELHALVKACFDAEAAGGRPVELSFTGEGEPLMNWRAIERLCQAWPEPSWPFDSLRLSASGFALSSLLPRVEAVRTPIRLQFSLHAARQEVRDRWIPRSEPLTRIREVLLAEQARFSGIELNVVLQDGLNDGEEDLQALLAWADPQWTILLNPLLTPGTARQGERADWFQAELARAGRQVRRYRAVASQIATEGLYARLNSRVAGASGSPV